MKHNRLAATVIGAAVVLTVSLAANASHSWNNYHWARTSSSFTLQVIDSNSTSWDDELGLALSQWSQSSKLDMRITGYDSSSTTRQQCPTVTGKVRSCNYTYGANGWLGLASINLDSRGHIVRGTSKMNDSYSMDQNQRRHVMCQELGHTIGLGHTSENGSSQNTCMDYSTSPTSTAPNSHDYSQLASIYGHTDTYNSYSTGAKMPGAQLSGAQQAMAGNQSIGVQVRKGVFDELWVAPDGKGGVWVHHITLAPGHEHTELLDGE